MLVWVEIILEKERVNKSKTLKKSAFSKIPKQIMSSPLLSCEAKVVYSILVGHCFEKDLCYPGLDTIKDQTNISKRTCQRAISELIKFGAIQKIRRGLGHTNIYQLSEWSKTTYDSGQK